MTGGPSSRKSSGLNDNQCLRSLGRRSFLGGDRCVLAFTEIKVLFMSHLMVSCSRVPFVCVTEVGRGRCFRRNVSEVVVVG